MRANNTHAGWLAGGGLEYGPAANWTAFVEYDFIGLGTNSIGTTGALGPATISLKQDAQMVKAGVNFKFNMW